jgi:hypothetical protein
VPAQPKQLTTSPPRYHKVRGNSACGAGTLTKPSHKQRKEACCIW